MILFLPFHYQDLISNSPYCLPYNFYDVNSENLALDQLKIPTLTFFFILITCLLDIILILEGHILSWPVMELRVKSLLLINYSFLKQYYISLSKKADLSTESSVPEEKLCFYYFIDILYFLK